ncbi:MAG: hypothetical protein EPN92_09315 [Chitinophagaceae bacterium]|nr:MAG: hypothetical protein EPN92_09315 [Chitinophagaceae bacterium]
MTNSRYNFLVELIVALFILLFTYTSVSKLLHIDNFIHTLGKSPLFATWAGFTAWSVVFGEWLIALLLLYHPLRLLGLYASLILMSLFTIYIGYMISFSDRLPCSCGGILQQLSWKNHFLLNIFLTLLAVCGIYYEHKKLNQKQALIM